MCPTDLASTVGCQQLVIGTEEFAGVGDVNGRLLFVSSEDPDFDPGPLKSFDGLWDVLLQSVHNPCGTWQQVQRQRSNMLTALKMLVSYPQGILEILCLKEWSKRWGVNLKTYFHGPLAAVGTRALKQIVLELYFLFLIEDTRFNVFIVIILRNNTIYIAYIYVAHR